MNATSLDHNFTAAILLLASLSKSFEVYFWGNCEISFAVAGSVKVSFIFNGLEKHLKALQSFVAKSVFLFFGKPRKLQ